MSGGGSSLLARSVRIPSRGFKRRELAEQAASLAVQGVCVNARWVAKLFSGFRSAPRRYGSRTLSPHG